MKKTVMACALSALMLGACKPTEKNYRAAYDAAIAKRQAEWNAMATEGLTAEDAPKPRYIDGDTLYFANEILTVDKDFEPFKEAAAPDLKAYNVAVGLFKMNTNARSGANALRGQGLGAYPAKALAGKWYIIGGSFENLDSVRSFIKEFKAKNPDYPYIGLNGNPAVIRK